MKRDVFFHLGKWIYTLRWFILILWLVLFSLCLPLITKIFDPFTSIGFVDPNSQSAITEKIIDKEFKYGLGNRFMILYTSDKLNLTDATPQAEIKRSLRDLNKFKEQHIILYPDANNKSQVSKDKHAAYAIVAFKSDQEINSQFIEQFKSYLKTPKSLKMQIGGEPFFLEDTKEQTQKDLYRAEYFAGPVTIITMLIVYGSFVAASLPIIFSGIGMIFILTILYLFALITDLSVFTINIALLLGLCLILDYSLFIISRFREEMDLSNNVSEATANTLMTAGKSIFFSGLAVFSSLSALLLFKVNVLFSVGIGGLSAVFAAVIVTIIFLPSILAILGNKINALKLPFINVQTTRSTFWKNIGTYVISHRIMSFCFIVILLLVIGLPFFRAVLDISNTTILPKTMESRQVFDKFSQKFGKTELSPILLLVKTRGESALTKNNISALYDLAAKIKKDPRVAKVFSIVTTDSRLTKTNYQMLYSHLNLMKPDAKESLKLMVHGNMTIMTVLSKYDRTNQNTINLINTLKQYHPKNGLTVSVTGSTVATLDVLHSISQTFIYAVILILLINYFIMLILLRSLILPLKAIFMTTLSLFASYGVLVFIIQYGYGHQLLHFEPQHMLDISMVIIIFCALFGVSMDYEVFLLTRIKENYEHTHKINESIIFGIDHSSKIITSAAIILILICLVFMTADIIIVKAFGLGIAVAVFIDAFLIRTILVPATMSLLGRWNWYLPRWLDKILPEVSFSPNHSKSKKH